jgi:uncharacterized protein (DUF983 family)
MSRLRSCDDCGERITKEVASQYEPACPSCGRLYPLHTTAEAARELGKDKTAKRVGLVLAVLILVIVVLIIVGWFYFNA